MIKIILILMTVGLFLSAVACSDAEKPSKSGPQAILGDDNQSFGYCVPDDIETIKCSDYPRIFNKDTEAACETHSSAVSGVTYHVIDAKDNSLFPTNCQSN